MKNYNFYNPTRVILGKGTIAKLADLVPQDAKILMTYGGGSIKRNGVYDQVKAALADCNVQEFGGIEANPTYETCMKAIKICKDDGIDFLLSVGGGSALDATKFIAAGACLPEGVDPWGILTGDVKIKEALPLGDVITLPATGSENNGNSVISRKETEEKIAFSSQFLFPVFSILDPETTYSLPANQVRNGIVDAYMHVLEQYMTFPQEAPLQDQQAESILRVLVEYAPRIMQMDPPDYDARAVFMDAAAKALDTSLERGVTTDWATHSIGHELTAFYGVAHGESLAIVWPNVARYKVGAKHAKLLQYARRVWNVTTADEDAAIEEGLQKTEAFFHSMNMPTALSAYEIDASEAAQKVEVRWNERGWTAGENGHILPADAAAILRNSA